MKTVVITGAGGYIGGQTAIKFYEAGYNVIGIDLVVPSKIVEKYFTKFLISDMSSEESLYIIGKSKPQAIVHCGGTSLVGPSVKNPSHYYDNNVVKTKIILDFLVESNISTKFIFSSSASVYGEPVLNPCAELDPTAPMSPYGESKLMCEYMLNSYTNAYNLDCVIFRYFNVVGADMHKRHGQKENGTHIIARILEAIKNNKQFTLFGTDYPTPDGTCVRDYVHVDDVASAHLQAVEKNVSGTFNLGTSHGCSNKEIIDTALKITGSDKLIANGPIREGDPAVLTGSSERFASATGWKPVYKLQDIIQHAWNWYNK